MVGARKLRARDPRSDDDEALGQVGEVVELLPGEDALIVRQSIGEGAGAGAGCDEDGVGGDHPVGLARAVSGREGDGLRAGQPGPAAKDRDALPDEAGFDVGALGMGKFHDAAIDRGEVHGDRCIA